MSNRKKHKQKKSSSRSSFELKNFLRHKKLPLILILIGIFFLVIPFFFYLNQSIQLAFFSPKLSVKSTSSLPIPTTIVIPSVTLALPVSPTTISGGIWGIADNGASYLHSSSRPGEEGAIILYAHNTDERFGPIRWLSTGASISLTTSDNKTHMYTVTKIVEVPATAVEIFSQKKETLILYTCSGFADLKRFVVLAEPSKAQKVLDQKF